MKELGKALKQKSEVQGTRRCQWGLKDDDTGLTQLKALQTSSSEQVASTDGALPADLNPPAYKPVFCR